MRQNLLEKVIAFSLFHSYAVLALDVVQISGTIKDPAGMFLPGANVQVKRAPALEVPVMGRAIIHSPSH